VTIGQFNLLKRVSRWRWIALGLSCALASIETLNFTEFCYDQGRYLGDQGLVDAVVQYEITHASSYGPGAKKYRSVEEFHAANAICCRIEKWGDPYFSIWKRRPMIWVRRIFGAEILIVDLWYQVKDEGSPQFVSQHYLINACGEVREGGGGGAEMPGPAPKRWE
jgi:hypothetical protein